MKAELTPPCCAPLIGLVRTPAGRRPNAGASVQHTRRGTAGGKGKVPCSSGGQPTHALDQPARHVAHRLQQSLANVARHVGARPSGEIVLILSELREPLPNCARQFADRIAEPEHYVVRCWRRDSNRRVWAVHARASFPAGRGRVDRVRSPTERLATTQHALREFLWAMQHALHRLKKGGRREHRGREGMMTRRG